MLSSFHVKFDIIIHLAGSGSIFQSENNFEKEKEKTVESTKILLKFIQEYCPNAKLLYASSAAVYGNNHTNFISEEAKEAPVSMYGKHKLEAEKLLKTASFQNNLNICIIRFFSVYGEGLKKTGSLGFYKSIIR